MSSAGLRAYRAFVPVAVASARGLSVPAASAAARGRR
jgi:hypothetical protein